MDRERLAPTIIVLALATAIVNFGFLAVNVINFFNTFELIGLGPAADNAAISMPGWVLAVGVVACLAGANPNQRTKPVLLTLIVSVFASALWLAAMLICQVVDTYLNDLSFFSYALFSFVLWATCFGLLVYLIKHLPGDKDVPTAKNSQEVPSQAVAVDTSVAEPTHVQSANEKWSSNVSVGYQWNRAKDAANGNAGQTAENFDWKS